MTRRRLIFAAAVALLSLNACTEAREPAHHGNCPDFAHQIQPLLTENCAACHGATLAEGDYRVDDYISVIAADAEGTRRVVGGDESSALLLAAAGDANHTALDDAQTLELFERWVVECDVSYLANELVHPAGWVHPDNEGFHGHAIRAAGWDLSLCTECHGDGDDPTGGPAEAPCMTCHVNGPTSCETCHGDLMSPAPPPGLDGGFDPTSLAVGRHREHLLGGPLLGVAIACDECHVVPQHWDEPGHIFTADGSVDDDPRAEVVFGALANASIAGRESRRTGPAEYDADAGTCGNVYCHGGALTTPRAPQWNAPSGTSDCSLCHDLPPANSAHAAGMPTTDCVNCHQGTVDGSLALVGPQFHLDVAVTLGDGSDTCGACHGSDPSGAPSTGNHDAHVNAGAFHGGQPCAACHRMPQGATFLEAVTAVGHIDSAAPAEVFPDGPTGAPFAGRAAFDNAMPVYDESFQICSNTYCHGGGETLLADPTGGISRVLPWTGGVLGCGSCHSVPIDPSVGVGHGAGWALTDCVLCHASAIDGAGALIFAPDGSSRHVNGAQDFNN